MHWIRWFKEKVWFRKMARLERKNYIEEQLGRQMPGLFSFAKGLGVCFTINPASIRFRGGKGWGWSCCPLVREIRVSIDPLTLEILPKDRTWQNRAMAHEIGHINAKDGPVLSCPVIFDYIYHERPLNCFFEELGAEVGAQRLLDMIYPDDVEFASLGQWEKVIKRQCDLCLAAIKKGDCPKAKEIGVLCQILDVKL